MTETLGRRERKKAATRQAIADAALRLFLERGYDEVGIREIAEVADVSTATVFKHFSGKEALVFDQDADQEAALVAAVTDRPAGRPLLDALRDHVLRLRECGVGDADLARFRALIDSTPALREHAERMWTRHRAALARAIAEDTGAPADDPACAALARFVLQVPGLARELGDDRAAVDSAFALLRHGWEAARAER